MANKDNLSDKMLRLTLRLSHGRLSASVGDPQSLGSIVYEPYEMNNGISPAANLREAFQRSELLKSGYRRALILNDAPVLIIPEEEYVAEEADTLYRYTFRTGGSDEVVCRQLPALNGVAAFAMNKDLLMVIEDHFEDIRLTTLCEPVWTHLYKRNFMGSRQKLFAWRQLGMSVEKDELHLVGEVTEDGWLCSQLRQYLRRVVAVTPQADFRNIAMAKNPDIPYDLKAVYLDEEGWQGIAPAETEHGGTRL